VSETGHLHALSVAVARIEQRQIAFEHVANRMIDILEVHNEKLDAILEAASQESRTSPSLSILESILATLREQESLLADLRDIQESAVRDELPSETEAEYLDLEPAVPGSFEDHREPGSEEC
jgi:hypothetical protein